MQVHEKCNRNIKYPAPDVGRPQGSLAHKSEHPPMLICFGIFVTCACHLVRYRSFHYTGKKCRNVGYKTKQILWHCDECYF